MFQPNETVVCINKQINFAANDGDSSDADIKGLTIGKKYQIKYVKNHGTYFVVYFFNDFDILGHYYEYRFIKLTEYRKQKLEKICCRLGEI